MSAENADPVRPRTRGDCVNGPRPCPWVSCRHHLAIDVRDRVVVERETSQSCALDVADMGPQTFEEVGNALGVSRERIRQIEGRALAKLRPKYGRAVADHIGVEDLGG